MYGHIAIACLFGVALAAPSGGHYGPVAVGIDSVSVPRYDFNYAVSDPHTGDNKSQQEVREGGVVKGSYSLTEPDGTLRIVDYRADPVTGFNAVVKRVGAAVHPQTLIAPVIAKEIIAPVAPIVAPISTIGLSHGGFGGLGHVGLGGLGHVGLGHAGLSHVSLGHAGLGHVGLGHVGFGHAGLGHVGLGHGSLGLADLSLGLGLDGVGHGSLWKH